MKRFAVRTALFIVGLAVIGVLVATIIVRASLPQLDGELLVSGLAAGADIERDAAGLTTVRAKNRGDLAYATGFAHAQDRFFQMDLTRRQAAGELAELIGPAVIDVDKQFRFHRFRQRAREVIAAADAEQKVILEAYAAGVNAGLQSLAAKPFEYFVLQASPQPWLEEDTVLVVYAMFVMLNDPRGDRDVARGYAYNAMPESLYRFIYPGGTPWDAPIVGDARGVPEFPLESDIDFRTSNFPVETDKLELQEDNSPLVRGSNNWAVSGALTSTGRAIVANDMHLNLSVPNVFYRARLILDGDRKMNLSGVTLPGAPIVVAGSNGKVAWGFTNSYGDWTDIVLLRPGADAASYRTEDGDRQFIEYPELIKVKGGNPVEYVVRETIWGPVLDDVDYPDGELAVSWIGHKIDAVNINQIDLETVNSVDEALAVANTLGIPPQNFVTGDAAGNIGWTIAGRIPTRSDFINERPADWSEQQGWTGWLQPEDYPRVVNPEGGRIWTANSRVVDGDALRLIGDGGYDLGARARQIRDDLRAASTFEPKDMLAIQMDDRALFIATWRDLLLSVLDEAALVDNPDRVAYRELVENWVPRAAPESVGYRMVRSFRLDLRERVFNILSAPVKAAYGDDARFWISGQFEGPLWKLLREQPPHLLPPEYESWNQLMLTAVDKNIAYFKGNFDGPLADRSWGELNTARIQHPLSKAIPILSRWLDMPRDQLTGDNNLPKAQGPGFGASERFAVSPGDEANGYFHIPTGPSGHPASEYYGNSHGNWVQGIASPFLPGPAAHRLSLQPVPGD